MFYNIKDIFEFADENEMLNGLVKGYFILARINSSNKVALISLRHRDRWANPVKVKDWNKITDREFKRICNGEVFKKVNRKNIVIREGRRGNMALISSAKKAIK
ncbi:hypothetical protein HYT26_04885 [Candidatus Pacearchaeota archaeon]|nr:hypothetical protein [Candidatus Pacearchaeota archaeon]